MLVGILFGLVVSEVKEGAQKKGGDMRRREG